MKRDSSPPKVLQLAVQRLIQTFRSQRTAHELCSGICSQIAQQVSTVNEYEIGMRMF